MKLKSLEQFESNDPCECGGNCGCGNTNESIETISEAKFVKDFDKDVLDAEYKADVTTQYPSAQFYVGKLTHFFGQLEPNLFFKAYYKDFVNKNGGKIKGDFKIVTIYSEKGSKYVNLFNREVSESVVTEKFNFSKKEVEAAAALIASAISQADKVKAKVHDLEYDKGRGAGFEISIDGEKYDGGSYVVRDNGDVVNAAIGNSHPNAVYNTIGNKDIADVFINMEKYESNTVTEAKGFKNTTDFEKFLIEIDGMGESQIKKIMGKEYIDTPGFYQDEKGNYDDVEDFMRSNMGTSEFEKLESWWESNVAESVVTEAKKYKFKELSAAWEVVYGEDMEDEYEGFYQEVIGKYKNKVTKADIATIWSNVYGEEVAVEYGGFYNDLKENLEQVVKLEEFNNIEEANSDGTISDDEDDRLDDLLGDVEMQIDELIQHAKTQAYEIGGDFRGPGMTSQLKKLMLDKLKRMKN
jgi:hypothetical protein